MTVHSTQLGYGVALSTGVHSIYTVPSGKRTIVKGILLQNLGAGTNRVVLNLVRAGGGTVQWGVTLGANASATESMNYQTWFVMNEGDELQVDPISYTLDVLVSGAELTV